MSHLQVVNFIAPGQYLRLRIINDRFILSLESAVTNRVYAYASSENFSSAKTAFLDQIRLPSSVFDNLQEEMAWEKLNQEQRRKE